MVIGIIGAGASGMAAAISASESANAQVLLFERQARVGRKLLATGNGRCNLSNISASLEHYHGDDPSFAGKALQAYSAQETLSWFQDLGLYVVTEPSGRVYPYSDQANSVVDVLRFALDRTNITLITGAEVQRVRKTDKGFQVDTPECSYTCDKLIIACGGLAGTKLGGSMSGYKLLRGFGHHSTRLYPALVQLKSSWNGCVSLKGVRANCHAQIFERDALVSEGSGELQFTEYGISGPLVFEISRDACRYSGNWSCKLDFLPDIDNETLIQWLRSRLKSNQSCEELLTGILHNRLGRVLCSTVGIRGQMQISALSEQDLLRVVQVVKGLEIQLTEPLGMDSAQVTAGGIVTLEFDPSTMESRLVPGLYACGEVLDIDGDCGGYNLQWAWSSGRLAGHSAASGGK